MASRSFDYILGPLVGLPGVEEAGPSTVQDVLPIAGDVSTVVVQMMRENDYDETDRIVGARFVLFVQAIESSREGPKAVQLIIPDKALRRIISQWERLNSRNRRHLRERARNRALDNPRGFASRADGDGFEDDDDSEAE